MAKELKKLEELMGDFAKSLGELKLDEKVAEGITKAVTAVVEGVEASHKEAIADKDRVIEQKTADVVGARTKYKKLKELTEEEKEDMSKKEIELHENQIALQEQQEKLREDREEHDNKERDGRKKAAFDKLISGEANKELREKMEKNYEAIKDSDKVVTEAEITDLAQKAFNMLGDEKPDNLVGDAAAETGDAPGGGEKAGFAESAEGKGLSDQLGLPKQEVGPDGKPLPPTPPAVPPAPTPPAPTPPQPGA